MKRSISLLLALLLVFTLGVTACAPQATATSTANEMQYMTAEETKKALESGSDEYIFLDVRQAESYEEGHVDGFTLADMHEANKNGNKEDGKAKMIEALGTETPASDKKYVLLCYSGKSYAQAGTDVLVDELKVDPGSIYTLEGGMEAWMNAGDDYKALVK